MVAVLTVGSSRGKHTYNTICVDSLSRLGILVQYDSYDSLCVKSLCLYIGRQLLLRVISGYEMKNGVPQDWVEVLSIIDYISYPRDRRIYRERNDTEFNEPSCLLMSNI